MNRRLLGVVALALAAAAGALTYYLNEGFEGTTFPPDGWTTQTSPNAVWERSPSWGPWQYYAYGHAYVPPESTEAGWLFSPEMSIPLNQTVYFFFRYYISVGSAFSFQNNFALVYADTGYSVVSRSLSPTYGSWVVSSGSGIVQRNAPVKGRWYFAASTYRYYSAYVTMNVDDVWFTDESTAAVRPSSLGRVKALYR